MALLESLRNVAPRPRFASAGSAPAPVSEDVKQASSILKLLSKDTDSADAKWQIDLILAGLEGPLDSVVCVLRADNYDASTRKLNFRFFISVPFGPTREYDSFAFVNEETDQKWTAASSFFWWPCFVTESPVYPFKPLRFATRPLQGVL